MIVVRPAGLPGGRRSGGRGNFETSRSRPRDGHGVNEVPGAQAPAPWCSASVARGGPGSRPGQWAACGEMNSPTCQCQAPLCSICHAQVARCAGRPARPSAGRYRGTSFRGGQPEPAAGSAP